jgi:anti-anti-sigma regulatory factor
MSTASRPLATRLPLQDAEKHMLRIERMDEGSGRTTVRATGRLTGPWVAEFEKALSDCATDAPVIIDLTDVSFVDRAGIALLRTLRDRTDVKLRCSAFVAEQIN